MLALQKEGLSISESARRLGISPSLVSYYRGSRHTPQGETDAPAPQEPPPVSASSDGATVSASALLASESLDRLVHERDNAPTAPDRIRAAQVLLQHSQAAEREREWSPGPAALRAFLMELRERHPDLWPE